MINTDLLSIGNTLWLGMANHIWQSTLFAAAAWLITIFLKKNRARIRYWIWFSVSIKFLIPFSLIVSLGTLIAPEWSKAPVEISTEWNVIQTINQPFNPPELETVSPTLDIIGSPSLSDKIPLILFSLWLCGSFAVLLNWHKRGMRVSRMVRKAEPLIDGHTVKDFNRIKQENRISNTVKLASTQDTMEPGVFGIFRPVLLLPAGILKHINDFELESILLHEIEHIRCKDNLIAFIHMLVEALFWFHPVVWWIGSRLVSERELACDESVLQAGRNPRVYAEGILKVCEYYFKSPLVCVSGVIGSDLKQRVEGIMKNQMGHKLSLVKKLILLVAGLSVLGIPLALGIINAPPSQAHPYSNDLNKFNVDEYKPDSNQVSGKPERNNESSEIINAKDDRNISSATNPVSSFEKGQKHFQEKNTGFETNEEQDQGNSSVISDAGTTLRTESSRAVQDTVLSTDAEDSIVPAQRVEAPVKVSSDTGNVPKTGGIELKAEDADAYISRGFAYLNKGQIEDAISDFNKAIELDPGKAVAYVVRGSVYHSRLNQLDNAISDYSKAIEIDPDLAVAYQNRGSVYNRLDQLDNAISDYSKAIEINPDFAVAYQDRGSIYQSQGRFDNAISDYSRALDLKPEDSVIYNYRGSAYFEQEQYQKAFNDFNRAIELDPSYASAYINRGTYYNAIRKFGDAIADYKKALELDPETPFSKKLKKYIQYDYSKAAWRRGSMGVYSNNSYMYRVRDEYIFRQEFGQGLNDGSR